MARRVTTPSPDPETPEPAKRGRKPRGTTAVPRPKPSGHGAGTMQSPESLDRDRHAMSLRSQGWTWQAISDHLGYGGGGNASVAVERYIKRHIPTETVESVRQQMLDRLDRVTSKALGVLEATHLAYHQGEPLMGPDGKPVVDNKPTLDAIATVLRVDERRAKLLGVDAPERTEVTVATLPPEIQAWMSSRKSTKD